MKIKNISTENLRRNFLFKNYFSNEIAHKNPNRRVVITGLGTVNPLGINTSESWENLKNLKSGIRSLENESYSKELPINCLIGAPIPNHFNPNNYKTLGTDNLLTQITISAADEAIKDSKLDFSSRRAQHKTGVNIGSSLPSISCIVGSLSKALKADYTNINRLLMLRMLTNLLASNVSIKYGLKGPLISETMACATGLNSIGDSYKLIKNNDADVMVCGGSENSIHPLVFHSMNKLNTLYLSKKSYSPGEASRPFDRDRGGFIIGEGSGILVIEELEHALRRNAKIYCEIIGYGSFGDAYHLTKPMENGEGGYRAMMKCLIDSNLSVRDIDVINCHATSTEVGDIAELCAIRNLFGNKQLSNSEKLHEYFENFLIENIDEKNDNFDGENLKRIVLNANKTFIGHLLGAAGSVETIFAIKSMEENIIIDNKNTKNPISNNFIFNYERDFSILPNVNQEKKIKYVLKNSFAFGGVNSSILFKNFFI